MYGDQLAVQTEVLVNSDASRCTLTHLLRILKPASRCTLTHLLGRLKFTSRAAPVVEC